MVDVNLYITAGVGPAECRIALSRCLGLMEGRAETLGCQFEVQTLFEGDKHGPKSAIVHVAGENVEAFAREYIGSLKVIFESPLRPSHGRKNWFLVCTRLELPETTAAEPDDRDLEFETFRAGGPGGQHQTARCGSGTSRPGSRSSPARSVRSIRTRRKRSGCWRASSQRRKWKRQRRASDPCSC